MRPGPVCLIIVLACSSGCTTARLRQRTINQGGTLPELQYQQVLDNLALFAVNPSALPWHVNLHEGTAQVTDSLSGGVAVELGPPADALPQLFGSRTAVAQWGMSPVVDATELRLLRFAYRRAHGIGGQPDPEFLDDLAHELKGQVTTNADIQSETALFFGYEGRDNPALRDLDARVVTTNTEDFATRDRPARPDVSPLARDIRREVEVIRRDLARIGTGWFRVGGKRDVPRDACHVGRNGDRYVWVCPDGREQLTEFTLTILKFSSLIKDNPTLSSPGSVKFSPGDRGG